MRLFINSSLSISLQIKLPNANLELWPGYLTSIRQHESKLLLNVEIGYKYLRMDTVRHLFDQCGANKSAMTSEVCGQIIMTTYNNLTYKIDSIDWDKNPMTTFKKGDKDMSYMEYYKTRYNITIRDPKQPLLVSKAKAKQIRGGSPEEFFLVPELCRLTGMTDRQRGDFRLMRDVAQYTRVDPRSRQERLRDFGRRICESKETQATMTEFGLSMGQQLQTLKGRLLPPEKILFGNNYQVPLNEKADWTGPAQKAKLFNNKNALENWYVLTPNRLANETQEFLKLMEQVSRGMSFNYTKPKM